MEYSKHEQPENIARRIRLIEGINRVSATITESSDLNKTMNTALEVVVDVVGGEAAGITLVDKQNNDLVLRAELGWPVDLLSEPMRIPLDQGMSGEVLRTNAPVVHNDLDGTEVYANPRFKETHFRSLVLCPMHSHGEIIGILSILSHKPNQFDDEMIAVLGVIADTVGVAVQNARLYENHVEGVKRLEAILHSSADGIIATDRENRIQLMNQKAEEILQIERGTLIGANLLEIPLPPHYRDKLLFAFRDTARKRKSVELTLSNNTQLSVLISPIEFESQIINQLANGWVIVLQDVTHLRQEEMIRAQFIQAAAHDMKNPLTTSKTAIRLIEDMLPADETLDVLIRTADNGLTRLQKLIDDLLQIEKIDSGLGFKRAQVDIRELCHEISHEFQAMLQFHEIEFTHEIGDAVPTYAYIDSNWLKRAIQNYLENAVKYASQGRRIQFTIFVDENLLHFEVIDQGPGIPETAQAHLFRRFHRLVDDSEQSGSGLGLAIAKSVAEQHQGQAYVKSVIDEGSTFGISIPL